MYTELDSKEFSFNDYDLKFILIRNNDNSYTIECEADYYKECDCTGEYIGEHIHSNIEIMRLTNEITDYVSTERCGSEEEYICQILPDTVMEKLACEVYDTIIQGFLK